MEEIKKSYKQLAKKYHPDKNINNINNKEEEQKIKDKFFEITTAYNILSDQSKRNNYDLFGGDLYNNNNISCDNININTNFNYIFDTLLKKKNNTNSFIKKKDINIFYNINCDLIDVLNGKNININIEKNILCLSCNGLKTNNKNNIIICLNCNGKGNLFTLNQILPGLATHQSKICEECDGEGKTIKFGCLCIECYGKGFQKQINETTLYIPKGISQDQILVYKNKGHQNEEGVFGDLEIKINIIENELFKKKGNHLIYNYKIDLITAITNNNLQFKYFDGNYYSFFNKEIIHPNKIIIIKGLGLPFENNKRGDLLLKFDVIFPSIIEDERKMYLKKLFPPLTENNPTTSNSLNIKNLVYNINKEQNEKLIEELLKDSNKDYKINKEENNLNKDKKQYNQQEKINKNSASFYFSNNIDLEKLHEFNNANYTNQQCNPM
jgi:DnaJ-related protein SCJ1